MVFSIDFVEEELITADTTACSGLIKIGCYEERFLAALDYWNVTDYRRHWHQGLIRIVSTASKSALVTSMYNPAFGNFIYWWPMYRIDGTIFFQNHILFLSELKNRFDPDDPFRFVPERAEVNPDGERISEWPLPIAELESFLSREWPLRNGRSD